ncbi:hypothetical protein [Novosphingobium album (ex Liu et al. 2023)]|uniref:hypothetical protein n=1 Tax=Novosphingobium album (ex Liu et al. 2023) TaxID=3031130 RepID=UPI0023B0E945|nr:hypothetical protein [Novosphingobium album (ex Liu et al. 2023)]
MCDSLVFGAGARNIFSRIGILPGRVAPLAGALARRPASRNAVRRRNRDRLCGLAAKDEAIENVPLARVVQCGIAKARRAAIGPYRAWRTGGFTGFAGPMFRRNSRCLEDG